MPSTQSLLYTVKSTLFLLLKLISTVYIPSLLSTAPSLDWSSHISKRGYAYMYGIN